jgi:hypothetical protein
VALKGEEDGATLINGFIKETMTKVGLKEFRNFFIHVAKNKGIVNSILIIRKLFMAFLKFLGMSI